MSDTPDDILRPEEVAAIEASYGALIPLDGPSHIKALDLDMDSGGIWLTRADLATTKSGVSVNLQSALQLSAVLACCTVIAEDVGKMPFHLYRWQTDGKRHSNGDYPTIREPLHPLARLMNRPNPDMTGQAFRETLTLIAMLQGTGYAWKARDGRGIVTELWPLLPGTCVPRRDGSNHWDLCYDVWFEDGTHKSVWPSEIMRITGLSLNGNTGLNRVTLMREVFGLSTRLVQAQAKFYGKDQRPSGVISSETRLEPKIIDRVREAWRKQFGPDGEGGVAVLDGGWKFDPMLISAKDADSIALWRLLVEEACRAFRVQPLKVMHATGTQSYASVDILNQAHLTDGLDPWLCRWEQEGERDLLAEADETLYWKFNRNAYLRPLPKDRWAIYQQARQLNGLTVNEIRDFEDLPPSDDERADDLFAPIGTNPAPASGRTPSSPSKPKPGDEAKHLFRRLLAQR